MVGRELVAKVLQGDQTERIPVGELVVSAQLRDQLSMNKKELYNHLGLDIVVLQPKGPAPMETGLVLEGKEVFVDGWGRKFTIYDDCPYFYEPTIELQQGIEAISPPAMADYDFGEVEQWAKNSDLFVVGLVSGGYQETSYHLGFEKTMIAAKANGENLGHMIDFLMNHAVEVAAEQVKRGAQAILLADDIAFDHGPYISPHVMQFIYFPYLKAAVERIKALGVPVFFHSDGNLKALLPDLVACGIDGIQCLDGMDLLEVGKAYPELVLWGNLDLGPILSKNLAKIEAKLAKELPYLRERGKYIFGTSSGLSGQVDTDFVKSVYALL